MMATPSNKLCHDELEIMKIPYSLGFYSVKITAIVIITVLYVIAGTVVSMSMDFLLPDENLDQLSALHLVSTILAIFSAISVLYYAVRVQLKHIPAVLDGLYGFNHLLLQEAAGGIVIAYTMFAYQDRLYHLMKELDRRITQMVENIRDHLRVKFSHLM